MIVLHVDYFPILHRYFHHRISHPVTSYQNPPMSVHQAREVMLFTGACMEPSSTNAVSPKSRCSTKWYNPISARSSARVREKEKIFRAMSSKSLRSICGVAVLNTVWYGFGAKAASTKWQWHFLAKNADFAPHAAGREWSKPRPIWSTMYCPSLHIASGS
jgi:hypothetical protein